MTYGQGLIWALVAVGWLAVGNLVLRFCIWSAEKRGKDISQIDAVLDKGALEAKPFFHPAVTVTFVYLFVLAAWPVLLFGVVTRPRK